MKLKITKIIFILAGIIMMIWFLLPLFIKRIINLGNITGFLISLLLMIYGLYIQTINIFIINFCHKTYGKIILGVMSILCICIFLLTSVFSYLMYSSANHQPTKETTIVILGCRVYGTSPSLMLEERLKAAYQYLKDNPDIVCVVSGGKGDNEEISEAKCMYTYLVDKGIDENRIYIEDKSTSTRENILFSKKVIEDNNLPSSITIITNEFHQYRAKLIAEDLGMDVFAISGQTAWWLFPTYYVRELFGIIYQFIF